jgi:hypothetical protein
MNPETKLQTEINEDLRKLGIKFLHIEKGRGKNKTHRKGWPDLLIFPGDKVYFVELKVDNNTLSKDQILFQKWAFEMGYSLIVVRSMADWSIWKLEFL